LSINRLFVANKPSGISCNFFLSQIKRKYNIKKAGFSGTLDPFASGVLIIAFGKYTKFFRFLDKAPKKYLATLHFGAKSESLDTEKIESIEEVDEIEFSKIEKIARELTTTLSYIPPKYSAKKVDGKRAYKLARENKEFELKQITTKVYEFNILEYKHPYLTFDISVSEGGYIRSIAALLAENLGTFGSLSSLKRLSEGKFSLESFACKDEKSLNPLQFLNLRENFYVGDFEDIHLGKVLKKESFKAQDDGTYFLIDNNLLSIMRIENDEVFYELNKVELC
jgi:tRNA pseudouridine55 synthase